jgi:hypothetical protein
MFEMRLRLRSLGAIVRIWGSRVNATNFRDRVDAFMEDVYGNLPTAAGCMSRELALEVRRLSLQSLGRLQRNGGAAFMLRTLPGRSLRQCMNFDI